MYSQLLYLTLANLESPSKVKVFFFFSPIVFKFSKLILLVMCHQRSQVPTTLVPINQPKKSQSHGEEYIKKSQWGLTTIIYVVVNHG